MGPSGSKRALAHGAGSIILLFLLSGCTLNEGVQLTNATGSEIELSETSTYKGVRRSFKRRVAPGATVWSTLDRGFVISTGDVTRFYATWVPPKSYTERVHSFGPFMNRDAYATLKKDHCIYLSPIGAERAGQEAAQPQGFPLCPSNTIDFTPVTHPKPRGPSLAAIKDLADKVGTWSCPMPAGAERIRPLYSLEVNDFAGAREARERIELLRRRSHATREAATTAFIKTQADFYDEYHHATRAKSGAQHFLEHEAKGGLLVTARNMDHAAYYALAKREHDTACAFRNKVIGEMLAEEPALASLRKEKNRPWLNQQYRIPCDIAVLLSCKR